MNESLFDKPAAVVYASESAGVLVSLIRARNKDRQRHAQNHVLASKETGDMLVELKYKCLKVGEWMERLKEADISKQDASNCIRIAENWDRLGHPSSVREALRMLSEDAVEQEAPPAPPQKNLPLCPRCDRASRVGQTPKQHCQDCKVLREQAAAQKQEAARNAPRAAPAPPAEPPAPAAPAAEESVGDANEDPQPPAKDAPPPWADLSRLFGTLIRSLDVVGAAFEAKETPERYGIQRKIEEARQEYERWYKKLVKAKE